MQSAHTQPFIYNNFVLWLTSSFALVASLLAEVSHDEASREIGCRKKSFKAEIQVRYHDQDTAVRRSEQLINVTNVDEQDYNVDVGDLC